MSDALRPQALLFWAGGGDVGDDVHEVVILNSGWLRVTWLNGSTSHVSPAAVKAVHGKGVSYGA